MASPFASRLRPRATSSRSKSWFSGALRLFLPLGPPLSFRLTEALARGSTHPPSVPLPGGLTLRAPALGCGSSLKGRDRLVRRSRCVFNSVRIFSSSKRAPLVGLPDSTHQKFSRCERPTRNRYQRASIHRLLFPLRGFGYRGGSWYSDRIPVQESLEGGPSRWSCFRLERRVHE